MAPAISPKKTWEGFAGSVTACLIAGWLCVTLLLHGHWWQGLLTGTAVVLAATTGDLVESMIKRDLDIKDMGTLLPGHGGVLERLDSLLVAAPVVWLLLYVFIPARLFYRPIGGELTGGSWILLASFLWWLVLLGVNLHVH
jgi:phosphatidate cytidylyltransferase